MNSCPTFHPPVKSRLLIISGSHRCSSRVQRGQEEPFRAIFPPFRLRKCLLRNVNCPKKSWSRSNNCRLLWEDCPDQLAIARRLRIGNEQSRPPPPSSCCQRSQLGLLLLLRFGLELLISRSVYDLHSANWLSLNCLFFSTDGQQNGTQNHLPKMYSKL